MIDESVAQMLRMADLKRPKDQCPCATRDEFLCELSHLEERFKVMQPEQVHTVSDRDQNIEGFLVIWNGVNNPDLGRIAKGGTRISPTLTLAEVTMLARTMALKNAAAGLPIGGAKSGLRANSDDDGFETKYRRFVSLCKPKLREFGGIYGGFGFDVGAKPIHAVWACDELGSTKSFTGKPVELGGTDYDREGIAGLGVATAAKTLLEFEKRTVRGTTFAVQGLGAMGAAIFKYFVEMGSNPRAISDIRIGGTYLFDSAIPSELMSSIATQNLEKTVILLKEFSIRKANLDAALYSDVDILFPAATQDVIHEENAPEIKARYVVEGANNPCSSEARTALYRKKIKVIPDFLANSGGIIAAYVELSSKISAEENARTRQNVVDAKNLTREKISQITLQSLRLSDKFGVEIAQAGRYLALKQLFVDTASWVETLDG